MTVLEAYSLGFLLLALFSLATVAMGYADGNEEDKRMGARVFFVSWVWPVALILLLARGLFLLWRKADW